MPLHDWSRVSDTAFHHFHVFWLTHLSDVLTKELLPRGYYALVEPVAGEAVPDVLTLQASHGARGPSGQLPSLVRDDTAEGAVTLLSPAAVVQDLDPDYSQLARHILVRSEVEGDRVVAAVDLVSRGNKRSRTKATQFVDKTIGYLREGVHLVVLDPHAPSNIVPQGFHALVCESLGHEPPRSPPGRDRQIASYQIRDSGHPRALVEHLSVGDALPDIPLFLAPRYYVRLPLERTYEEAFGSVPERFRAVLTT